MKVLYTLPRVNWSGSVVTCAVCHDPCHCYVLLSLLRVIILTLHRSVYLERLLSFHVTFVVTSDRFCCQLIKLFPYVAAALSITTECRDISVLPVLHSSRVCTICMCWWTSFIGWFDPAQIYSYSAWTVLFKLFCKYSETHSTYRQDNCAFHCSNTYDLWEWSITSSTPIHSVPGENASHHAFWLLAWHSGRTSVFGRRTFPVLRSTCSWRVTTYVGKQSAIGQPTRPTKPFILSRKVN